MFLIDSTYEDLYQAKYLDYHFSQWKEYIPTVFFTNVKNDKSKKVYICEDYYTTIGVYRRLVSYMENHRYRTVKYKDRKFITGKGFLAEAFDKNIEIIFCAVLPNKCLTKGEELEKQQKIFYLNRYLDRTKDVMAIHKVLVPLLQSAKANGLTIEYVDDINSLVLDRYELPKFSTIKQVKQFKESLSNRVVELLNPNKEAVVPAESTYTITFEEAEGTNIFFTNIDSDD